MLTHIELLGLPAEQTRTAVGDARQAELTGLGHPAVMRAWLIQAMTGRRASEVLMTDFEPLSDIPGLDAAAVPEGMVARHRYQETEIDAAPNTVLVDRDVVEIIREIGRDGREIGMDRRDMLDLVQLDRRTDRILPNGYCLLPPTRS
ncbi:hypothetical protein ACFYQ5_34805 [Streptomyces sp. NPDC005794]|uniref:hypothetical protein n=1 Tax=Streptomyces sp. NPDC005794 TaxID=3364733 RepID=UPI0036C52314